MSKHAHALLCSILLLTFASAAQALTLSVDCNARQGLNTISAAVKALHGTLASLPNTINVSGACHENITVENIDHLTLNALPGASITDASDGTREVIDVGASADFTLNGFTITATCSTACMNGAGADAVSCYHGAECLLVNNTISGAGNGSGVGVYPLSKATVQGGSLQDNYFGLFTNDSGQLFVLGATVRHNLYGVYVNNGGNVTIHVGADGLTPTVISNNTQQGIYSSLGGTISVHAPATVANNGADGIYLALGSKLFVGGGLSGGISVTGNNGAGVNLNDLAIAKFGGNAQVTGNAGTNIACNATTAVSAGAIAAAGGAGLPFTNCTN